MQSWTSHNACHMLHEDVQVMNRIGSLRNQDPSLPFAPLQLGKIGRHVGNCSLAHAQVIHSSHRCSA